MTDKEVGSSFFEENSKLNVELPEIDNDPNSVGGGTPMNANLEEIHVQDENVKRLTVQIRESEKKDRLSGGTASEVGSSFFGDNSALNVKLPDVSFHEVVIPQKQDAKLDEVSLDGVKAQIAALAADQSTNEMSSEPQILADLKPQIKREDILAVANETSAEFDNRMEKQMKKQNAPDATTEEIKDYVPKTELLVQEAYSRDKALDADDNDIKKELDEDKKGGKGIACDCRII